MLNFSYGSNMSTKYIREYCPSARPIMLADLPNFQIEFRRFSTDLNGGISTIMPAPGGMVRGVIYDIPEKEILELDILEDVPKGLYVRESYFVLGEDKQWYKTELYRVANPEGPFTPSPKYVDMMIEGATEHDLDVAYVENLIALRNSLST